MTVDESQHLAELRKEFRADVAVMREVGSTKWKDIELGPKPLPAETSSRSGPTPEEQRRLDDTERRRIALAASGGPRPPRV